MKTPLLLFVILCSINCYSQCDIKILEQRPFDKFKNANDKKINIKYTIENNKAIFQMANKELVRMKKYIKESFEIPKKPKIDDYISELDVVRSGFGIYKIKETEKLDQMVYCFLTFLRAKLTKIKLAAFAIDNVKELAIRIESIYDEIEKEGMPSIYDIDKELRDVAIKNHIIE